MRKQTLSTFTAYRYRPNVISARLWPGYSFESFTSDLSDELGETLTGMCKPYTDGLSVFLTIPLGCERRVIETVKLLTREQTLQN